MKSTVSSLLELSCGVRHCRVTDVRRCGGIRLAGGMRAAGRRRGRELRRDSRAERVADDYCA